ncbi:hypothetical protein [Rhodococcus sp. T7]|uniref:hypothetical protein n=1 Tax=Rhodococcus sp. T7 TaxID=627444 RepID=UPI00135C5331|nr:hypothetical protein [Rhodococcus sp. T7]
MTIASPTTILTRTITAQHLVHPEKANQVFIIEIDTIDDYGQEVTRSALVTKCSALYSRDSDPQDVIVVEFAHPRIEKRTYNPDDEIVLHEFTYEHLEEMDLSQMSG